MTLKVGTQHMSKYTSTPLMTSRLTPLLTSHLDALAGVTPEGEEEYTLTPLLTSHEEVHLDALDDVTPEGGEEDDRGDHQGGGSQRGLNKYVMVNNTLTTR